jgi:hypothetical protein
MSHTDHPQPPRDTTHRCPRKGCNYRVRRSQLACPRHWALVDRQTQRRVYAAYRSGDREAHTAAVRDAIDEINTPEQA